MLSVLFALPVRGGVAGGRDAAVMTALLATPPVALQEALRDLPETLTT